MAHAAGHETHRNVGETRYNTILHLLSFARSNVVAIPTIITSRNLLPCLNLSIPYNIVYNRKLHYTMSYIRRQLKTGYNNSRNPRQLTSQGMAVLTAKLNVLLKEKQRTKLARIVQQQKKHQKPLLNNCVRMTVP